MATQQLIALMMIFLVIQLPVSSALSFSSVKEEVGETSSQINWTTDIAVNGSVFFGRDSTNLSVVAHDSDPTYKLNHSVIVSGLLNDTIYFYRLLSNNSLDIVRQFRTAKIREPVITNVNIRAVTQNSAVIEWTTDEAANSIILSARFVEAVQATRNDAFVTLHSMNLSGLDDNTSYVFSAKSCNRFNRCSQSNYSSFNTPMNPARRPLFVNLSTPSQILIAGNKVTVGGVTAPNASVQFFVGGRPTPSQILETGGYALSSGESGRFSGSVDVGGKENRVRVEVSDRAGKRGSATILVLVDDVKPTLTLGPLGSLTDKNIVNISGTVSEDALITVSIREAVGDSLAPLPVQNVKQNSVDSATITIEWDRSTEEDLLRYLIYRSDTLIGSVGPTTTVFKDAGLASGTFYRYSVSAQDRECNEGEKSNALEIRTLPGSALGNDEPRNVNACAKAGVRNQKTQNVTAGPFNIAMPLLSGNNALSVTATDRAGNENSVLVSLLFSTEAPRVLRESILPQDRSFFFRDFFRRFFQTRTISGTTNLPNSHVMVYINPIDVDQIDKATGRRKPILEALGSPDAEVVSDASGNFVISGSDLLAATSPVRTQLDGIGSSQQDSRLQRLTPNRIATVNERASGAEEDVRFVFVARDQLGRVGEPVDVIYRVGTCSTGNPDFSIDVMQQYNSPTFLSPERLKDGTEVVGFVLNVTYKGRSMVEVPVSRGINDRTQRYTRARVQGFEVIDVEIEPQGDTEDVFEFKEDAKYRYGLEALRGASLSGQPNEDKNLWYFRYSRLHLQEDLTKFADDLKNDVSFQMYLPLKITVHYNLQTDGRQVSGVQSKCDTLAYVVDRSKLDPRKVMPDFLLNGGLDLLNTTQRALDRVVPKLQAAVKASAVICFSSWILRTFTTIWRRIAMFQCGKDIRPYLTGGKLPDGTTVSPISSDDFSSRYPGQCENALKAWDIEEKLYQAFRYSCDRTLCHDTPVADDFDYQNFADGKQVMYEAYVSKDAYEPEKQKFKKGSALKLKLDTNGKPVIAHDFLINQTERDERESSGKTFRRADDPGYTQSGVKVWYAELDIGGRAKSYDQATQGQDGAVYHYKNEVYKRKGNELIPLTENDRTKRAEELLSLNKDKPEEELRLLLEREGYTRVEIDEQLKGHYAKNQKNKIPVGPRDEKPLCGRLGSDYLIETQVYIDPPKGGYKPWEYRLSKVSPTIDQDGKILERYPKEVYFPERDQPACFGQSFGDKIINPRRDFVASLRCACLSSIYTRLRMWQRVLRGLTNCLSTIKTTGQADAGVCKEIFTQYVCNLMANVWERVACGEGIPILGKSESENIGNVFSAISGGITESTQDLVDEYDNAYIENFLTGGGSSGIMHKVCLAALGIDIGFDLDAAVESGFATAFATTVNAFPARRQYIATNPSNGYSTYEYRTGLVIIPGCELSDYNVELSCVDKSTAAKHNLNCEKVRDLKTGGSRRGCDCWDSKTGEVAIPFDHPAGYAANINQNYVDASLSTMVEDYPYRFDHVKVTVEPRYQQNAKDCLSNVEGGYGVYYFPIDDQGVPDIVSCQVEPQSGVFRCLPGGIALFHQRGYAIFTRVPSPSKDIYSANDEIKYDVDIEQFSPDVEQDFGTRSSRRPPSRSVIRGKVAGTTTDGKESDESGSPGTIKKHLQISLHKAKEGPALMVKNKVLRRNDVYTYRDIPQGFVLKPEFFLSESFVKPSVRYDGFSPRGIDYEYVDGKVSGARFAIKFDARSTNFYTLYSVLPEAVDGVKLGQPITGLLKLESTDYVITYSGIEVTFPTDSEIKGGTLFVLGSLSDPLKSERCTEEIEKWYVHFAIYHDDEQNPGQSSAKLVTFDGEKQELWEELNVRCKKTEAVTNACKTGENTKPCKCGNVEEENCALKSDSKKYCYPIAAGGWECISSERSDSPASVDADGDFGSFSLNGRPVTTSADKRFLVDYLKTLSIHDADGIKEVDARMTSQNKDAFPLFPHASYSDHPSGDSFVIDLEKLPAYTLTSSPDRDVEHTLEVVVVDRLNNRREFTVKFSVPKSSR